MTSARPRLLDLFCGSGGAATGYHRAGFEVVGVDIKPQPHYPFEFHQADAMELLASPMSLWGWMAEQFQVIHASPPCQEYAAVSDWGAKRRGVGRYPGLIEPTRALLQATGRPYAIENVRASDLHQPTMLCGTMFGLRVIRHRFFETNFPLNALQGTCAHIDFVPFMHKAEKAFKTAMDCAWMTNREGRQAIPPAYTEWIGKQLLATLPMVA